MNDTKHTPGPWVFLPKATRENDSLGFSTFTANVAVGNDDGDHGNYLASIHAGGPGAIYSTQEAVEANARLIAAAPDLYEAILAVKKAVDAGIEVRGLGEQVLFGEAVEKCRLAIEKATGQAS